MSKPTDIAEFVGLSIFGGICLILGLIAIAVGICTPITTLIVVGVLMFGGAGLCVFRIWQQERREQQARRW